MRGWLRQLRKDRGLTQREVAARLGILNFYVFSYMIYLKPSRICSRSSMSSGIVTR